MSNKVPVFWSVGAAYSFLFNNFFEIIRLIWLPVAIIGIGTGVLFYTVFAGSVPSGSTQLPFDETIELIDEYANIIAAFGVAAFLMIFVITMAPYRIYFDLPRGESIFYLRFGLPEFRYFIFTILFQILLGLVTVLFGLLTEFLVPIFGGPSGSSLEISAYVPIIPAQISEQQMSSAALVYTLLILLQVVALIYLSIRLSLAPAIIAAERKVGLIRSWRLTRGNFWRIFIGLILLVISILLVFIIVFLLAGLLIALPFGLLGSLSTELLSDLEAQDISIGIGSLFTFLLLFLVQLCLLAVPLGMTTGFIGRAYEGCVEEE